MTNNNKASIKKEICSLHLPIRSPSLGLEVMSPWLKVGGSSPVGVLPADQANCSSEAELLDESDEFDAVRR